MKFSKHSSSDSVHGFAALAIIKMLLEILRKKKLLSNEEIDIILNCAEAEVDLDSTDVGGRVTEAKFLIGNLMKEADGDDTYS